MSHMTTHTSDGSAEVRPTRVVLLWSAAAYQNHTSNDKTLYMYYYWKVTKCGTVDKSIFDVVSNNHKYVF